MVHWDEAVVLGLDYLTGGISTDLLTSQQFGAALDAADQFVAGFSDAMTAGMSTRAREALWGELATRNHEGAWFTAGSAVGTVYATGLAFVSPCGPSKLISGGIRGLNYVQLAGNVTNAYENYQQGNYFRMGLDIVGAAGNVSTLRKACFAAGTPLLTPTGHKAIELFRPGDWVLAAPEGDPAGAVEAKRVEEVFVTLGRLLNLHVGGQVIRTTAEHPFWVRNRGWTPAEEVAVGDELRSHDGKWVPVEDWCDTGEVAPVYNLRVAEYHTYFVGSREWGFSVWAHNTYGVHWTSNKDALTILSKSLATGSWVQPFERTRSGLAALRRFLVARGVGTGARAKETGLIFNITGLAHTARDVNGGIRLAAEVDSAARFLARIRDPGELHEIAQMMRQLVRLAGP